jgi:hypothetical protein
MRKYQRDFVVDGLVFTLFVLLVATGALMKFVLPKGSGESLAVWGLGRHDWGSVHFWIAVGLLSAIALHLLFHWSWISAVVRGRPRELGARRVMLGLVAVAGLLAVAVVPIVSPVRQTGKPAEREMEAQAAPAARAPAPALVPAAGGAPLGGDGGTPATASSRAPAAAPAVAKADVCSAPTGAEIHGTMSLEQVARASGVPAEHLIRQLRLPAGVSRTEPLRQLTGAHGFTMDDVRRIVTDYQRHC